jgi:hypothetical protein
VHELVVPLCIGLLATGFILVVVSILTKAPPKPPTTTPDPLIAALGELLKTGEELRGPIQNPPKGPPRGTEDEMNAWEDEVLEALKGKPNAIQQFKVFWDNFENDGGILRYNRSAKRLSSLTEIIEQLRTNAPTTASGTMPAPVFIQSSKPNPNLPQN